MAKVKFILKEPKAKDETLVYLVFRYQYSRFKYSTGEKINPKYWNANTQRAKETKRFPEYPEFNARLNAFENDMNTVYRKLLNDSTQPNNNILKSELERQLGKKILIPKIQSLINFIESYIEESQGIKRKSTITVYKITLRHIENYCLFKNITLNFEDINLSFYNSFVKYLSLDLGMADNTVGKHIKTLKTFLNEATERGINTNLEFKKKGFKRIAEEADTVYLNLNELKQIEMFDFSQAPNLEKVRDLFLIGCYTGLRFSDFSQINKQNINECKSIIEVRTKKTNEKVTIPIHPVIKKILFKYDNEIPRALTNQAMNRYLKEIVRMCGIDNSIEISERKAGELIKRIVPKYEQITTHTARRSFATNCYLADIPAISIMKITGHKTEKSFLGYIKVSQEENASKLLNHPFFT